LRKFLKPKQKNRRVKIESQKTNKIEIYECELENVEDFQNSFQSIKTEFPLIKGKYEDDMEKNIHYYFQVNFFEVSKRKL
jgi:hypothetical protein